MGIELDVLVGHPEHDLLFVATQVALAAQMKNPKQSVNDLRNLKHDRPGQQLSTLVKDNLTSPPRDRLGRSLRSTSIMFTESEVYSMLLRSKSKQTEPFRKWVTEEVLPTIRKTGSYNAEDSLKSRVCWSKRL